MQSAVSSQTLAPINPTTWRHITTHNIHGCATAQAVRPGTNYPHVTWAHVMLRARLGCERWFNIEFYGADSHFCHSAYVTWSHVGLWSAHVPARLWELTWREDSVSPALMAGFSLHRPGSDHRPGACRDLWWTKWHCDKFFSQFFGFFPSQNHSTNVPYSFLHLPHMP